MHKRISWLMAGVLVLVAGCVPLTKPVAAASTVEAFYGSLGPWAVTSTNVVDSVGRSYRLVYPADLGPDGAEHPVVTWGNGTFATPDNYPGVLNQLASWGFLVVAFATDTTKTGIEILGGAQYLVAADADPTSPFFHHVDTDNIGALGHSQGAGGAINATNKSGGLITTVVPINLTRPLFVDPEGQFDLGDLDVPTFLLGGSLDILFAPPFTIRNAYDEVPGPAAVAILRGADHLTIQNTGGRYLGYLTAWLMYQLQGDAFARTAFVGAPPEINTNTAWRDQAEKFLP
jgi:pimeloyl-ACP methyl ester carboxylesterase